VDAKRHHYPLSDAQDIEALFINRGMKGGSARNPGSSTPIVCFGVISITPRSDGCFDVVCRQVGAAPAGTKAAELDSGVFTSPSEREES